MQVSQLVIGQFHQTNYLYLYCTTIYCTKCALRIKTKPNPNILTEDTYINVFDADDDQQYYLYPLKTKNTNEYTLNI